MMDIIALRRDLHQYPEVGFTEFRTAAKVVELLRSLGYEVSFGREVMDEKARRGVPSEEKLEDAYHKALQNGANPQILAQMKGGFTGVVAELKGIHPGPTVAFRFDMDALPVTESVDIEHYPQAEGFASHYYGQMHACAHDAHTSIGLGLAEALADGNFSGTVKLIFQPAEEGVRGAYSMMCKGVVDDVEYIICQHLGTGIPLGKIHGGAIGFLATTKMEVHFYGVASHAGASPEEGKNALLGAATALLNIHALPRFSEGTTRINVGILEGGTGANIVPDHAKMVIETRSSSAEVNQELERRVRNIIAHSASMHELEHKIEMIGSAIPIHCDEELAQLAIEEAKQVEGFHTFTTDEVTANGSEDAGYLIRRVQERGGKGTYLLIGCDLPAPHHHPRFDIQEEVLPRCVTLLKRIAKRLLQEKGDKY